MDNINGDGNLDNDKMVRALLMKRNTPDPGCRLSPSEVLFGRKLRDTLPFIRKDIDLFANTQISDHWRKAWQLKEESLKARYVKTHEKLHEHSRPLQVGDQVLIQNQTGQYPTRWDRSGVIVDARGNDQYCVKVAGTGRITLRNRRFLRKYNPHLLHGSPTLPVPAPAVTTDNPNTSLQPSEPLQIPARLQLPVNLADESSPDVTSPEVPLMTETLPKTPLGKSPSTSGDTTQRLTQPPLDVMPRRSARNRTGKKFYEPETGSYVPQNP